MSKKHFEALADALYRSQTAGDQSVRRQWHATLVAISNACRADNPRFDAGRFEHRALFGHNATKTCCRTKEA